MRLSDGREVLAIMNIRHALFAAVVFLVAIATADAQDTTTCLCTVNVTSVSTTYTGLCTTTAGWATKEPYGGYRCQCGITSSGAPHFATCSSSPTASVATATYDTAAEAQAYCQGVLDEDVDDATHDAHEDYCIVKSGQGWPYNCTTDKGVTVDVTLTNTSATSCARSTLRTLCSACDTAVEDTDAASAWRDAGKTSVCHCETFADPDLPYARIDAGCVTDDVDALGTYKCDCGPVRAPCTIALGNNSHFFTRVYVERADGDGLGCTAPEFGYPMAYHASDYTCMESADEPACKTGDVDGTGSTTNARRTVPVADTTCHETTRRDACTVSTKCSEMSRIPCIFESVTGGSADYEAWKPWSACSSDLCGGGWQTRVRSVRYPPFFGAPECDSKRIDIKACTTTDCGPDCVLGEWGLWSECEGACSIDGTSEYGYRSRARSVAAVDYAVCPEQLHDYEACYPNECVIAHHRFETDRNPVAAALFAIAPVVVAAVKMVVSFVTIRKTGG